MASPMELGENHPIRKSRKQKDAFREEVRLFAQENGYAYKVEPFSYGGMNIVLGNPEQADYLITAHYDTPAFMLVPNLLTPCNFVTYYGYQMLMVFMMVAVSIAVGIILGLLSGNDPVGPIFGVLFYWSLLLLTRYGPANKHNANDNTSGVITVLECAKSLPHIQRECVCFVLFDREEQGLKGSAAYRKAHKTATDHQIVLNLDCVGDGNTIMMFPTKKLKKDKDKMTRLRSICGSFGYKVLSLRERGFSVYPSDQKNFPYGVGIAALHHGKMGLYLSRIHTHKDTVLEETNVNILRAALTTLITREDKK